MHAGRGLVNASIAAVALLALAMPALAHDEGGKGQAGGEGPTPGNLPPDAFTAQSMQLLGRLDLSQLGAPGADAGSNLASAWGWVDPLTGREYALMARTSDLAIVDVTVPTAPTLIGNVARTAGTDPKVWRDVRVVGNWAFIGVDGANAGIQSFDLTRVRGVATPTLFTADAHFNGISNSHTLATNFNDPSSPFLYAVGSNTRDNIPEAPDTPGGMQIINVSNPTSLSIAGSWQDDGYIHETSVFTYDGPDNEHDGKKLAFNCTGGPNDPNAFSIVDVTTPGPAVVRIGQGSYPGANYAHQGWLTEDHRYFLIDDELDEANDDLTATRTYLYDVSDLDNPVFRGFFEFGNGAIDHNLYIAGDYVFQANYTRGIRVFEIGDLESLDPSDWLTEIAFFDTYPANDGVSFNGAWQVYPYLPSGNILVSDINGGLFVLAVPEPGAAGMLLVGLGALALRRRRSVDSFVQSSGERTA